MTRRKSDKTPTVLLTRREVECLTLVADGKSDAEIAKELDIAASTVHFHVENAKKKFSARSRAQAVAQAVHAGLVKVTPLR